MLSLAAAPASLMSPVTFQAEEDQPFQRVPVIARAIGGERFVGPALLFEAVVEHRDGVLDALLFADQPGAGDRPVHSDALAARPASPPSTYCLASARAA